MKIIYYLKTILVGVKARPFLENKFNVTIKQDRHLNRNWEKQTQFMLKSKVGPLNASII